MMDKRQYVRIEAFLPIKYRILSEDEYESARKKCREQKVLTDEGSFVSVLSEIDIESLKEPDSIITEGMDPLTARVYGEIDRKLNLLLRLLVENTISDVGRDLYREVNLSGGGVRLDIPEKLKQGDKVELEINLPIFPPITMPSIAEVVRVDEYEDQEGKKNYETAFKFTDIDENDREKIIQYIFKLQRKSLRNRSVQNSAAPSSK